MILPIEHEIMLQVIRIIKTERTTNTEGVSKATEVRLDSLTMRLDWNDNAEGGALSLLYSTCVSVID